MPSVTDAILRTCLWHGVATMHSIGVLVKTRDITILHDLGPVLWAENSISGAVGKIAPPVKEYNYE